MTYGTCLVTSTPDGAVITTADPRILISGELLHQIERVDGYDFFTLTDDVLTLNGLNRSVVYRINRDGYLYDLDAYPAEWPD